MGQLGGHAAQGRELTPHPRLHQPLPGRMHKFNHDAPSESTALEQPYSSPGISGTARLCGVTNKDASEDSGCCLPRSLWFVLYLWNTKIYHRWEHVSYLRKQIHKRTCLNSGAFSFHQLSKGCRACPEQDNPLIPTSLKSNQAALQTNTVLKYIQEATPHNKARALLASRGRGGNHLPRYSHKEILIPSPKSFSLYPADQGSLSYTTRVLLCEGKEVLRINNSNSPSPTDLFSCLCVPASNSFCSLMTRNFSANLPLMKNVFFW